MELAALASAAIPDLSPTGVVGSPDDPRDFSAAVVFDRQGSRWRVRSPLHEEAAMRLETELQVLSGFTAGIRAGLPFRVPSVAGAVRLDGMRTFVYHDMPGVEMELEDLTELGGKTAEDIGRVIAAVHALPADVVENADLPVYSADQFRQRRLNELDQAATTGRIPSVLLRRWENALEEMELWDFTPVVTHGDLHEDNLLVDHDRLVSVTGWTDLHIGDPAEDFAWLASSGNQSFTEEVVTAYWQHRSGGTVQDEHLLRRAVLAAEFALAQWLVRGLAAEDEDMSAEAEAMLGELQADVEEHGGQEISAAPAGPRAVPAPETEATPREEAAEEDASDEAPAEVDPSPEVRDSELDGSAADDLDDAVIVERDTQHEPVAVGHVESADPAETGDVAEDPADAEPTADTDDDAEAVSETADGPEPDETVEPSTTALDLDEVRQLDIRRPTNPS
ncbi:phosphotransferase [Citricoccus nitrophenolicus]|uniref:Phosphotransferase n=1 Tax=Citricoccus nitrophenolicus TaxID=863575 RepID=A0ABV0ILE4_9MICC